MKRVRSNSVAPTSGLLGGSLRFNAWISYHRKVLAHEEAALLASYEPQQHPVPVEVASDLVNVSVLAHFSGVKFSNRITVSDYELTQSLPRPQST